MTLGMYKDPFSKSQEMSWQNLFPAKDYFAELAKVWWQFFPFRFSWRIILDLGHQYCFAFCFLLSDPVFGRFLDPLGSHRSRYPQNEGRGAQGGLWSNYSVSSRFAHILVLPVEEASFRSPFRPFSLVITKKLFAARSLCHMLMFSMIQSLEFKS